MTRTEAKGPTMSNDNTGSRIEPPPARLIGRCLICDSLNRARAVRGVHHDGMPAGTAHWLCGLCAGLVDSQPGLIPIVENCAAGGLKFKDVVKAFGRYGMTPPSSAAEIPDVLRRVMAASVRGAC